MSLVAISPSTEVLATRRLLYRRRKCNLLFCRIVCHLQHRVRIDRLPPRMSSISTKCVCQGRSWQLPLSFPLERYMNSSVSEKRFQWDPCYVRQAFSVYSEKNDPHVPEEPCT